MWDNLKVAAELRQMGQMGELGKQEFEGEKKERLKRLSEGDVPVGGDGNGGGGGGSGAVGPSETANVEAQATDLTLGPGEELTLKTIFSSSFIYATCHVPRGVGVPPFFRRLPRRRVAPRLQTSRPSRPPLQHC